MEGYMEEHIEGHRVGDKRKSTEGHIQEDTEGQMEGRTERFIKGHGGRHGGTHGGTHGEKYGGTHGGTHGGIHGGLMEGHGRIHGRTHKGTYKETRPLPLLMLLPLCLHTFIKHKEPLPWPIYRYQWCQDHGQGFPPKQGSRRRKQADWW